MYARKPRHRLLALILLLLLTVGSIAGTVVAKYVTSKKITGAVTFSAEMAENLQLLEHQAERTAAGDYKLLDATVTEQTYTLMPGVDIKKDPHVIITGKSPIKAYLFVEVLDTLDLLWSEGSETPFKPVTYELTDNWLRLEGVSTKEGGSVYVYSVDGVNPAEIDDTDMTGNKMTIYLLKENSVTVSQYISKHDKKTDILSFSARLSEVIEGKSAAQIYADLFA